jgi:YD repeat-containing protein
MRPIARLIAPALAVGVLASGCSTPAPTPAPVVTETDGGDIATLTAVGPVPGSGATGPTTPTVAVKAWLKGSGLSVSTTPTLAAPVTGDRFTYEVYDVSAGEQPGVGRAVAEITTRGPWTVPAGRLTDGRQYAWRARSADAPSAQWTTAFPFTVDTVRAGLAPRDEIGGISTHLITGVPTVTWMSRTFRTVSGSASSTLDYTPGRAAVPGLPPGWRWSPPLVSRWTTFTTSKATVSGQPVSVYVADADERSMTFTRNSSGVYEQTWSNGRRVDSGQSATLTRVDAAWQLFEVNGQLTVFSGNKPVAVSHSDLVTGTAAWGNDGRLTSVQDPSARTISMRYGTECAPAPGFEQAPDGFLCQVRWWDSTSTDIHYVKVRDAVQIGLVVDAVSEADPDAALGLGFGWDASGRLSALRSPLVTGAAAADTSLRDRLDLLTQIEYDPQGRVAAVAAPAPAPDAERLLHTYTYPTVSNDDVATNRSVVTAVTAHRLTGGLQGGKRTALRSTLRADRAYEMAVDAATWRPLQRVDRDGATTQMLWDAKGQRVTATVDYESRVTSYAYDTDGRRTGFTGPSSSSSDAYAQTSTYDEAGVNAPMKGLAVRYWPTDALLTAATSGDWIGRGGEINHRWAASPVGGPWAARLTGTWNTGTAKATWLIEATVSTGARVKLYVDNAECALDALARCRVTLASGDHSLRIDISAEDAASLRLKAGTLVDGADPSALRDLDTVTPDFNVTSSTTTSDSPTSGGPALATRSFYEQPWTGNPTRVTAAGGLTSQATYEPRGLDGWGRKVSSTTPGGRTTQMAYWPIQGEAIASPCPNAEPATQAGALRAVTRTDGVVVERWYDTAGRTTAVRVVPGSGDVSRSELACWNFAPDGSLRASALFGPGGAAVERVTVAAQVGGDPRITQATITANPPDGIFPVETTTQSVTDLLGRLVSYTDPTGIIFTYTYDVEGNQLTRTATLANRVLAASAQEYDSATGRPVRMAIDGQEMARISYDRFGRVASVRYSTGVTQVYSYRPNGSIEVSQVRLADGTFIEDSTKSNSAGRVGQRTTEARDSAGQLITQRRWNYGYDQSARLVQGVLAVRGSSAGAGSRTQTFDYGFGAPDNSCGSAYARPGDDLNRTSGARNGTAYIVCYDGAGRPASTTDPLLAPDGEPARLTWDDLGRFTATALLEVTWTWGGLPRSIKDTSGPVAVRSDFAHAQGRLVAQRSSDGTTTAISRMAYANPSASAPAVILDGAGAPIQVRLLLPGGALWKRTVSGGAVTIDHPGIRGELVVTSDGAGALVPGPGGGVLVEATGPYGEPLAGGGSPRPDAPTYGYGFGDLESTVPGGAGIVLKVARPYLPALGIFLAFDPEPGSTTTGYGFAEADPVNFSDPDGAYSWWDFARNVLAVASITASLMIPGAQWYTVLAISVLTSSASIGVTALERDANGQDLTAADWILEGVSVAVDMAIVGAGAAKAAWTARRAATSVTTDTVEELTDSSIKTVSRPANTTAPPTLTGSVTRASLMVAGVEFLNRASAPTPTQPGGAQQGGGVEPEECPNEDGCTDIPARAEAHRGPDRL